MSRISARLLELSKLEDGWLDDTGKAVKPSIIKFADEVLTELPSYLQVTATVFPTPEGNILVEWSLDDKETSVEFFEDNLNYHVFGIYSKYEVTVDLAKSEHTTKELANHISTRVRLDSD